MQPSHISWKGAVLSDCFIQNRLGNFTICSADVYRMLIGGEFINYRGIIQWVRVYVEMLNEVYGYKIG